MPGAGPHSLSLQILRCKDAKDNAGVPTQVAGRAEEFLASAANRHPESVVLRCAVSGKSSGNCERLLRTRAPAAQPTIRWRPSFVVVA